MDDLYVTITGMRHYMGKTVFKPGTLVLLVKEPGNEYDENAIRVDLAPVGCAGYVANSPHTVIEGTKSADRIYDSMAQTCFARIIFAKGGFVVARLEPGISEQTIVIRIGEGAAGHYSVSTQAGPVAE